MINLISAIIILSGIIGFRVLWVRHKIDEYSFYTLHYLTMNPNLEKNTGSQMSEFWPRIYVYSELWNWNFKRYIVYLDHYEDMKKFMSKELKRNDLTLEKFNEEMLKVNPTLNDDRGES
jgi:hypothetical protein